MGQGSIQSAAVVFFVDIVLRVKGTEPGFAVNNMFVFVGRPQAHPVEDVPHISLSLAVARGSSSMLRVIPSLPSLRSL